MIAFVDQIRRYLWAFVEFAFVAVLAIVLLYFIMGGNAGSYIQSVIDTIMKFAGSVPTPSLIGLAVIGLIVYMAAQRFR
ncbi:MAG: hypothetical protein ACXWJ6_07730 [Xanthobacteraceae bacterium]